MYEYRLIQYQNSAIVFATFLVFMSNYHNKLWTILYGRGSSVDPDPDQHGSALIWLYWISIGNVNPDSNSG
jgi:hypothetical protein